MTSRSPIRKLSQCLAAPLLLSADTWPRVGKPDMCAQSQINGVLESRWGSPPASPERVTPYRVTVPQWSERLCAQNPGWSIAY